MTTPSAWRGSAFRSYSMHLGARWNAQGSFPATYLNADLPTARANARRFLTETLQGQPLGVENIDPSVRAKKSGRKLANLPGIACRSAAEGAPIDGEELAWFDRHVMVTLDAKEAQAFEDWYGRIDW
ncbi:MAG: hypothetical protein ACRDYE_05445 [Acidimicrobiales bacterium]